MAATTGRPLAMWKQLVLAAAAGGLLYAGWIHREEVAATLGVASEPGEDRGGGRGGRRSADPVIVAPVALKADDVRVAVVGTGLARRSVTLRAKADGVVVALALAPEKRFSSGDALLSLDDRDAKLALALAETRAADAERVLARAARLRRSGVGTEATLDDARTKAEVARLEAEQGRRALDDLTLRAPFDGVASLPGVEIGDRVETGDAVGRFDDRSAIRVEIALPEALLPRVRVGMPATATTPSAPGRVFSGSVAEIDSRVDPGTRAVTLRVEIPNGDDVLRPGASFTVALELGGEAYPATPELAIQFSRGTLFVWRVEGGTVARVPVRLVRRRAGEVLVDGALKEGDLVVVEGSQRLEEGETVEILTDGPIGPVKRREQGS